MRLGAAALCFILVGCGASKENVFVIEGDRISKPLAGLVGDAKRGRNVFVERTKGHCVACHAVNDLDIEFQGNVGPNLTNVGLRLDPSQLRLRIVDASVLNDSTLMPPYFRTERLNQVLKEHERETALSAQDIEDVIAYLSDQGG